MNRKRGLRCQSGCRFHSYLKWSEINRTHREQTKKEINGNDPRSLKAGLTCSFCLGLLSEDHMGSASSPPLRPGGTDSVTVFDTVMSSEASHSLPRLALKIESGCTRASMGNLEASILTPLRKISWPARGVAFVNNLVRALIGPWTGTGKCCRGGWWCLPLDQYHSLQ